MSAGRKHNWPGEEVKVCFYKAPESLREKILHKVKALKALGFKEANFSSVQRVIIEKNIDDAERFFQKANGD